MSTTSETLNTAADTIIRGSAISGIAGFLVSAVSTAPWLLAIAMGCAAFLLWCFSMMIFATAMWPIEKAIFDSKTERKWLNYAFGGFMSAIIALTSYGLVLSFLQGMQSTG